MNDNKQNIEFRKIKSERPLVEAKWSVTQCNDAERILGMVDSLIATAISSHQSPHHYILLQSEKSEFIREFLETSEKYRVLVNEY